MAQTLTANPEKIGLRYWMDRVLEEHWKLRANLAAEPVHDLRVALRRCILIADVVKTVDGAGDWKAMRKQGRRLFRRLGELRDTQMLEDWVKKLGSPGDPTTDVLLAYLIAGHEKNQESAHDSVKQFDRKQWQRWSRELAPHYRHIASDRPACELLLLEIWESVLDLYRRAQKSRSRIAYHRVRVELKKFRYAAENFLPSMYSLWAPDLKYLQDLLGEIHDLSILRQAIAKNLQTDGEGIRTAWLNRVEDERNARLQRYRAKMTGKSSPLAAWRDALPDGRKLRPAGLSWLAEWAYFLTPDFSRVRRVARLSLQLYDGFSSCGLIAQDSAAEDRATLHAAALLEEVGRYKKGKAHHKESYRMIRALAPPAGWTRKDLEIAALIARFHRRALPRSDHKLLRPYDFPLRQSIILRATVLRFANAFRARLYRGTRRLMVEDCAGVIVVRADGFPDREPLESKLSEARRLLEFACQRPVHILAPGTRMISPRIVRPATRIDAA